MNDTYRMDGPGSADPLERELRAWLRSFDPGEMPPSARMPAMSELAGMSTVSSRRMSLPLRRALGVLAVALFGVAFTTAMILSRPGDSPFGAGVIPTPTPVVAPPGDAGEWSPDYWPLALGAALAVLAGAIAYVGPVRGLFQRVAFPSSSQPLDDVRPLRSRRLLSPLVLGFGLVATVIAVDALQANLRFVEQEGSLYNAMSSLDRFDWTLQAWLWAGLLILLAVAPPLRYRLSTTSSRLLLLGMIAMPATTGAFRLAETWPGARSIVQGPPLIAILTCAPGVLLAIAIARRSGRVLAPPVALAGVGLGVAAAEQLTALVYSGPFPYGLDRLDYDFAWLTGWLFDVGLLVILWLAWVNRRAEAGAWAWRLLLVAGACFLLLGLERVTDLLAYYNPMLLPDWFWAGARVFREYVSIAGWFALAAGVLAGIRPSAAPEAPHVAPDPAS